MLSQLREYAPEELLGRASPPMEMVGAEELVSGRRVLVTGAAGSVGTPLVRMLAGMRPSELLLLDHHEHTLFRLRLALGQQTPVPARLWLADVRDRRTLDALFGSARPDVVFHLAAYKHVPLGEENPDQTVEVNLAGTRALIEASEAHGVSRFVYPSSDKAVNPPSVYGCTKKLAEELTLAADKELSMGLSIVRFVNIVGTRGSVIETLTGQVSAGNPITLTDAGMTRYWITMPEATRLLVQTAAAPVSGVMHLPDTGPAINLADMARRLCNLLTGDSNAAYPIQMIGARPGERMHEILLSDSEVAVPTEYPGILRVETSRAERPSYGSLSREIDRLLDLARAAEMESLRGRLLDVAMSLQ